MKGLFRLIVAVVLGYFIYFLLYGTPDLKAPAVVDIPKGAGVNEIADKLKNAEVIRSKFGFETLVWIMRSGSKLQAGEYKFENIKGLADVVRILTQGLGASNEKQFTIIEGWGISEIGNYFEEKNIVPKEKFLSASAGKEGYLFPDTYRVLSQASAEDITRKMLENFDVKLTSEMRDDIKTQGKTIFDITRMASIVEAEVPHEADRPIIAGILWKRLDVGMPLQVDSTLNYATGGKNSALTTDELKIDSPYNTYKYRGLPPTPIGNPGLSALRAAIYPRHTAYWYFLSDKDGQTHFARTLEEHNENKAKYLK